MRMQEPEQWQSTGQEGSASQEYGGYRADYTGRYESEQQQKIYPQEERGMRGTALVLLAMIILSSVGFFLTVAGIVGSAIVLKFANGQQAILAGGGIGLASSIIAMLVCIAIFVIGVVALAMRARRVGGRIRVGI
jgi:uncharacterized iron-regulated membrane protein